MSQALRIALLMHSVNPRGGVVHALELADALCERGHAVTLIAAARPGERLFRATRAQLELAPLHLPADLPNTLDATVGARISAVHQHLLQCIDAANGELPWDVLHSQDGITANALAKLKSSHHIAGYVRTVHHLDTFNSPRLMAWQQEGVKQASHLLCVSDLWQQHLRDAWGMPSDRVSRVNNGVNLQRFTAHVGPTQREDDAHWCKKLGIQAANEGPVWLSVGGIEGRKNTARLLQAFALARQQCPSAQLVVAGGASLLQHDAEVQAFQALQQQHGMGQGQAHADRLIITGPLPDEALPALYRRATAVAMPSLKEGFGLVVLEALACGTRAVVSRIAPFTEHLGEEDVFWVDPQDVFSIAQGLLRSLPDAYPDSGVAPLSPAMLPDVCTRMSWAASAIQHEAIYQQHVLATATETTP